MKKRPATPSDRPIDDGGKLIADLQTQCESLRTWQAGEAEKLAAREQQLANQTAELDEIRAGLEADLTAQNESRHALQQARETLKQERTKFQKDTELLGQELTRVEDLQARVELDQAELTNMRTELDGEWTSLCRIRRANEKLASELDAERERLQKTVSPELKLTKAA